MVQHLYYNTTMEDYKGKVLMITMQIVSLKMGGTRSRVSVYDNTIIIHCAALATASMMIYRSFSA